MAMAKLVVLFRTRNRKLSYGDSYNDFLMLVDRLPGLRRKAVSTIYATPSGPSPYQSVVELYFDSREAMREALTSEVGVESGNLLLEFAGPDAVTFFADVQEEAVE